MSEPISLSEIVDLRNRVMQEESISTEELAQAINRLRENRMNAKPQQRKSGKAPVSLADLAASMPEVVDDESDDDSE